MQMELYEGNLGVYTEEKKYFLAMACEFRAIWVLHQSSQSKSQGASLLTSKRFPTVEKRVRAYYDAESAPYFAIPSDKEVVTQFNACMLKEQFSTLDFDKVIGVPPVVGPGRQFRVFLWDPKVEDSGFEKEWPLGPTASLSGSVWPFIFVSTSGSYEETVPAYTDRYFVCGVVATYTLDRLPLIELPQVTCGYKVLEDLMQFLPSTSISRPHISVATKFQFYLKSALPFGSPVVTSLFLIDQYNTVSSSSMDAQLGLTPFSSTRVASWKPFFAPVPLPTAVQVPSHLRLDIVEQISFQIGAGGTVSRASIEGVISCDCDISGTPEIVLPIDASPDIVITTHACAKLNIDDIPKLCFVPMSTSFEVAQYLLNSRLSFPISAKFRLFQIAPRRFRFQLNLNLSAAFSYFTMSFSIAETGVVGIAGLSHLVYSSSHTKADLVNSNRIVWTVKNPAHFDPNGEALEGVTELEEDFAGRLQVAQYCKIQFSVSDRNFSNISIPGKQISIFPNPPKNSTSIKWETLSSGNCQVVNSHGGFDIPLVNLNE